MAPGAPGHGRGPGQAALVVLRLVPAQRDGRRPPIRRAASARHADAVADVVAGAPMHEVRRTERARSTRAARLRGTAVAYGCADQTRRPFFAIFSMAAADGWIRPRATYSQVIAHRSRLLSLLPAGPKRQLWKILPPAVFVSTAPPFGMNWHNLLRMEWVNSKLPPPSIFTIHEIPIVPGLTSGNSVTTLGLPSRTTVQPKAACAPGWFG
jgi:hypothetical protein